MMYNETKTAIYNSYIFFLEALQVIYENQKKEKQMEEKRMEGECILIQDSEFHGSEGSYYTDYFPVSGVEEAEKR